MKKTLLTLMAFAAIMLSSCGPIGNGSENGGGDAPDTTAINVTSFPRKHLIEQFTGEECGYCPDGMVAIETFLAGTSKDYIWVGHHYGYGTDEYTIPANSTIGGKLGVKSAPNVVFDRTKHRAGGTSAYAFHPGYLVEKNGVTLNDADTALASVVIDRRYDALTRELTLTVHGQVLTEDSILLLSVLIKENGTIGMQHDYTNTYEGWSEFRHVKTVRKMLSAAMGDKVEVAKHVYTKTYTFTLPAEWVADNCMAVAYITKNATTVQPIINAEQVTIVDGTDGGESIKAEGLTRVPVSDTYPEEGAPLSSIAFTSMSVNTQNLTTNGYVVVTLQAPSTTVRSQGYSCYPYMQLYVFTRTANLAPGTYPISDNYDYGVVAAGYRDDEEFSYGASMLYYVFNQAGNLYPMQQWLLRSGELVVGEDGAYSINATTLNGSSFVGTYTPAAAAPMRKTSVEPVLSKKNVKFGVDMIDAED